LEVAVGCLETRPGIDNFDLFLFDVAFPSETVESRNKGKITYNHPAPFEYNGLLFLLNNLDILRNRINHIAIITAFKSEIIDMKSINVFGKRYGINLSRAYSSSGLDNLVFKSGINKPFAFTILDKGRNAIAVDVNSFIEECYPKPKVTI
jgi:hypothetical protein